MIDLLAITCLKPLKPLCGLPPIPQLTLARCFEFPQGTLWRIMGTQEVQAKHRGIS